MAAEKWFRDSEGNDRACGEGTVSHDLMSKDGSFTEIDGPGGNEIVPAAAADGESEVKLDLTKLKKKELYDEAVRREVPVTEQMTIKEILAAIGAKEAENA